MTAQPASKENDYQQLPANMSTWCPVCREEIGMISAEKSAAVCQCSRRRIYRWIEEGGLHFVELPSGEVMVCGWSLSRKMDELDSATHELSASCAK